MPGGFDELRIVEQDLEGEHVGAAGNRVAGHDLGDRSLGVKTGCEHPAAQVDEAPLERDHDQADRYRSGAARRTDRREQCATSSRSLSIVPEKYPARERDDLVVLWRRR
jgi:hypothetical protein